MTTNSLRIQSVTFLLMIFCSIDSVLALDGDRKGFMIGGGLRIGATSQEIGNEARSGAFALGVNLELGYAPNNSFAILYFHKADWFKWAETVEPGEFGGPPIPQEVDRILTNGLTGLGIKYYLKPISPSFFLTAGAGLAWWAQPYEENTECALPKFPFIFPCLDVTGPGLVVGGGYEFARHFSAEVNLMWSKPSMGKSQFADACSDGLSLIVAFTYLAY